MSRNYGTGVSRVLDTASRQFTNLIFQAGKPPLDSEFTLLADLSEDWRRIHTLQGCPSGVLGNAINNDDAFITNSSWSNWFKLGQQKTGESQAITWVCVNGWLIPVTGTKTGTPPGSPNDSDTWNKVTLDPPPSNSGDSRIDFVFLEVWLARVPPNPSTLNKPSASTLYRYGNVESGYTYLADDIQDPAIGFETTQRTQLQYRVRVVSGLVGLTSYPDGFDPAVVKARGAASADTSYTFTNMRMALGDPGLWRAGDGTANSLGTVDGYTYAVPLCAVFRRNSVAWDGDPGQNLNGGFNRNPTAIDRTGATTFTAVAVTSAALTSSALSVTLVSTTGIPLPLTPATSVYVQIGDEILTYSSITGTTMTITPTGRGQLGTKAEAHPSGSTITVLSGRPDGLFSDQITKTDILDLRHAVNPNGFDYNALLKGNLDKLLRGELRAGWKRTGGGPQGPFVFHQDKISASAPALGVTKLDAPDGHRMVFSDAAMQQVMEFVASVPANTSASEDITTPWGLTLSGTVDNSGGASGTFSPGDIITIPVTQLKNSLPGSAADQVQFISDAGAVSLRIDGYPEPLTEGTHFSVSPVTGPSDDLVITLDAVDFPTTQEQLLITFHVQWGPGRGISRRPDQVHSVSYLSAGSDILIRQKGIPADNTPMNLAWSALWSKYRDGVFHSLIPVTAESYVDLGSKTLILTPFRYIALPSSLRALDGDRINLGTTLESGTDGVGNGTTTYVSASADFVTTGITTGDALYIPSGAAAGHYTVASVTDAQTLVMTGTVPSATGIVYSLHREAQGLMPLLDVDGNPKWNTTDPLNVFSGSQQSDADRKNIYLKVPRHLVPGWGEVRVPIVHTDHGIFDEGVNFLVHTTKGTKLTTGNESEVDYLSFDSTGSLTARFSTLNLNSPYPPASYNAVFSFAPHVYAGMRFFTDSRNLGRQGLELPPFYGIARLFAVYNAVDYITSGSAYNAAQEVTGAGANNLIRQDFEGPVFWIEIDDDGDSTFILNADVIDLTKSATPIADFASGHYVIEATIFGFDRNSFDLNSDMRLVLCRYRDASQANTATRSNNVSPYFGGLGTSSSLYTPDLMVPGPALASDEIAINYSRTPYQGDAWGSQTLQQDITHKQGPLLSSTLYQLISTELDEANLTRPNQKGLEVLASTGFVTTLGTGRLSGDLASSTYDFRNVGYEDWSGGMPTSGVSPRPPLAISALGANASDIGSSYHGCTERLPLGARFLDKDFRGDFIGGNLTNQVPSPLLFTDGYAPGISSSSIAVNSSFEQSGVQVGTSSLSSGQPGEIVVHVDGEQGNYGLLVNFRTNRGGSGFAASAPQPGGEFAATFQPAGTSSSYSGVLAGTAYLVRNTVTSIGATEVSAGGELMMLITTEGHQLQAGSNTNLSTFVGTNGTGESNAAVDLYRISGHPLEADHVRFGVNPSSINLAKKTPSVF